MYPLSLQDKATIKNSRPEDLLKRFGSLRGAEQIQEHTADDDERDGNHPDEAQPLAKKHSGTMQSTDGPSLVNPSDIFKNVVPQSSSRIAAAS